MILPAIVIALLGLVFGVLVRDMVRIWLSPEYRAESKRVRADRRRWKSEKQ